MTAGYSDWRFQPRGGVEEPAVSGLCGYLLLVVHDFGSRLMFLETVHLATCNFHGSGATGYLVLVVSGSLSPWIPRCGQRWMI